MNKTITIGIPVYNGEKFLQKALQSVINQTLKVNQILICDNNSTDNTLDLIHQFSLEHPGTIINTYVNKSNIGALANFKKCFELCDTDYLLLLSVDDRLKKNAIEKLIGFYEQYPNCGVVVGTVDYIDANEKVLKKSTEKDIVVFNKGQILELVQKTGLWLQESAALYNMELTKKIGYSDSTFIGGDERYWAKILMHFPLAIIPDSIVNQMVHKYQLGNLEHLCYKDKIAHFEENIKIANLESDATRRKQTHNLLNKWAANQCVSVGRKVWKNHNKYWLSVKYWHFGVHQNPNILLKPHFWRAIVNSVLFR